MASLNGGNLGIKLKRQGKKALFTQPLCEPGLAAAAKLSSVAISASFNKLAWIQLYLAPTQFGRTLGAGLVLLGVLIGLYQIAPRHDRADSSLLPLATQDVAFHSLSVRAVGSESASRFVGMPIEAIEVGQRVLAHNPDALQETELNEPEPNPESWRVVRLVMSKHDGGRLEITLLRSLQWLEEHGAEVGAEVLLDTAELNACGAAQVISIESCPVIAPGPGRVVIGTFRHDSSSIVDLPIEGLAEPIGTTSDHPFWSRDRAAFVAAGELHGGEALLSAQGESLRVESVTPRPGTSPVHNLEIQGLHTYTVSDLGVVIPNNRVYRGGAPKGTSAALFILKRNATEKFGLSGLEDVSVDRFPGRCPGLSHVAALRQNH